MNVIIMAAGIGSRLGKITNHQPKCLIQAGGETLISRIIRLLAKKNITNISVVTGYKAELIHKELGDSVQYFHNPFFTVTNSIASLWLARDEIKSDTLLMNADLFFEEELLDVVCKLKDPVTMLSDSTRIETADYRFGFDGEYICRYGKQLTDEETDGEYVGVVRVNKDFSKLFKQRLENMIMQNHFNDWWEDVIYSHIAEGAKIHHKDIAGTFWTEVDCLEDYERLMNWTHENSNLEFLEEYRVEREIKTKVGSRLAQIS